MGQFWTFYPIWALPHLPRGYSIRQHKEVSSAGQSGLVPEVDLGLGMGCAGCLSPRFQPHSEQRCPPLGPVGLQEEPEPSLLEPGNGNPLDLALGCRPCPGLQDPGGEGGAHTQGHQGLGSTADVGSSPQPWPGPCGR